MNTEYIGFLNDDYLQEDYLGDVSINSIGSEVRFVINKKKSLGSEVDRSIIGVSLPQACEVALTVLGDGILSCQVDRLTSAEFGFGSEINLKIIDTTKSAGSETALTVTEKLVSGSEVHRFIRDLPNSIANEINRQILERETSNGSEIKIDRSLAIWLCEELGYLSEDYLSGDYLTQGACGQQAQEVTRKLFHSNQVGSEVQFVINAVNQVGSEVQNNIVDYSISFGSEIAFIKTLFVGSQTRAVLYNATNLRVLCDFPSRGFGDNWTATSTEAGDFSVNNLNTDIVEQIWRSEDNTTNAILVSNTGTPQGEIVDTLAILNHNFTTSAVVTISGSNDVNFNLVNNSFSFFPTLENHYYIAEQFPTQQSRYWRIAISDPTNPNGHLSVGCILFGSSVVMQGECFVDEVQRRQTHYADSVETEGFTNVSNDRALKTSVSLEFRRLKYRRGNYKNLKAIFEEARTSLKCLWIPDSKDPNRFGVFGKLTTIPDETHINMGHPDSDLVDFDIEVDESK